MTHKEFTKHIRNRLAAAGIKAKCRLDVCCGDRYVRISEPVFNIGFTPAEQTLIVSIVLANRMTYVRGMQVVDNGTLTYGKPFLCPSTVTA